MDNEIIDHLVLSVAQVVLFLSMYSLNNLNPSLLGNILTLVSGGIMIASFGITVYLALDPTNDIRAESTFICPRCGKEYDIIFVTAIGLCEYCYEELYGRKRKKKEVVG